MSKSFHEKFGPLFKSQFDRKHTPKIDWSLTGGVGNFPSHGLKNLIEGLGISTMLTMVMITMLSTLIISVGSSEIVTLFDPCTSWRRKSDTTFVRAY